MRYLAVLMLAALCACTQTGYQQKDGAVVFVTWDEGYGRREHPVAGVDASSFEILSPKGYAKDRSNAYFRWMRLEAADPASLVALSDIHAKDRQRVFYEDKVIPGADPATFVLLDVEWGRDGKDVYLQRFPIEACDPSTFTFLERDWQRDARCAYSRGRKLAGADPGTFVVLNYWYAKDSRHVYHNNTRELAGADPATFVIAKPCESCGRDAQRCYRFAEVAACGSQP